MSISVRAVVVGEDGSVGLREVYLPEAGPGEVRVKLAAAGVCHSDLSLSNGALKQPKPAVLGHEGAGTVEFVGEGVAHVAVGDRVVLNWAPACRECWHCRHSEPHLCPYTGKRGASPYATLDDGTPVYPALGTAAFAEQTVVGAAGVIPIPDDLAFRHAALIGCAVLTGVGAVTKTAAVQTGQSVAVIGVGGVGLSVVQGARLVGASPIIAIDTSPAKHEFAMSSGATHFLEVSDSLAKEVRALTGGHGVDHAFEAVGTAATIKQAWSIARRGGHVTVVGVGRADDEVSIGALELWHFARTIQVSIYGSCDPPIDVPEIAQRVSDGALQLDALISNEIALGEVPEAFERMLAGHGARSLIVFDR